MLKDIKKLGELISSSKKILLMNHVRMDMDAFGSLSALFDILNSIGKDVRGTNDEMPQKKFNFLGYENVINPDLNIKEFNPDLVISLDTGSIDRLGSSYENNKEIINKADFVVIDHHKTNSGYGDLNIVDSKASSVSEMIFKIISELDYEKHITPKIATALLSGIYTDTNIFYNSNTSSKTYTTVAKLLEYGADFRTPYYELYKKKTLNQSRLWGEILINKMKISENKKVLWAIIPKNVLEELGTNDRDLEGLISEFFINIDGVEIAFISYEIENKIIKTSFRSTPKYDTSIIAGDMGGGGHKQASGFISNEKIEEVEKLILQQIKKEFNL